MASNYVEISEEHHLNQHAHHHYHSQSTSPRSFKRQFSSSSSCASGHDHSSAPPRCVCAPATHANSFKCRLHRIATPPAPIRPAPSSSSSRTVEAQ